MHRLNRFRRPARALAPMGLPLLIALVGASIMTGSIGVGLMLAILFALILVAPACGLAYAGRANGGTGSVAPPGVALIGCVISTVLIMLLASSTPWDFGSQFWLIVALCVWATAGTVWLVKIVFALVSDGPEVVRARFARWAAPFAIGLLGLLVTWSGFTFVLRFELSKPAFDQAASDARAGKTVAGEQISLGFYSGEVDTVDASRVSFFMGFTGNDAINIVKLPDGPPKTDAGAGTWRYLGGGWWMETVVMSI